MQCCRDHGGKARLRISDFDDAAQNMSSSSSVWMKYVVIWPGMNSIFTQDVNVCNIELFI